MPEATPRPWTVGVALAAGALAGAALLLSLAGALQPALERRAQARADQPMLELLAARGLSGATLDPPFELRDPRAAPGHAAVPVRRARSEGAVVAVLLEVTAPHGYGGEIRLLVAVDGAGKVLGVRTLAHRETPGVGDLIDTDRSDWIEVFTGRSLGDPAPQGWTLARDGGRYDARSGATVTSRAVVAAVRDALQLIEREHAALFGAGAPR